MLNADACVRPNNRYKGEGKVKRMRESDETQRRTEERADTNAKKNQ